MDMLEIGRTLTPEEDRTHFGIWCMMSSPLLIGCDMTRMPPATLELLKNTELIAIDQDVLGQQAYVVKAEDGCISVSGAVRDPHILRADNGWFYQVVTDMDISLGKWTCRGIVMMRSKDLVNWEPHKVHFPDRYAGKDAAKADAVWAPQTIYDPSVRKYMVYFSLHSPKDGTYPKARHSHFHY